MTSKNDDYPHLTNPKVLKAIREAPSLGTDGSIDDHEMFEIIEALGDSIDIYSPRVVFTAVAPALAILGKEDPDGLAALIGLLMWNLEGIIDQ